MTRSRPRVLLAALVIAVAVALVVGGTTSATAFGAYNARWDGASTLRAQADAVGVEHTVARNTTAYRAVTPNGTVALVLSPDRGYDERERDRLRTFVRRGGTLVVAEDYGPHGNELVRAVGADARFDGRPLRDERYHYRSPAMPVARHVANDSLTANVSRLTLNHGTALAPGTATVLVRSSGYAYLDTDRNEQISETESLAQRPVVTVESVGDGRVVTVSDPSLFINTMLERPGNRRFVRTLFGAGDQVLLDYSHTADVPPLMVALLVVRETPALQALLGGLFLAGIGAWHRGFVGRVRRARADDRPTIRASVDDVAAHLHDTHPEWDADRVRRVAGAIARERDEESGSHD